MTTIVLTISEEYAKGLLYSLDPHTERPWQIHSVAERWWSRFDHVRTIWSFPLHRSFLVVSLFHEGHILFRQFLPHRICRSFLIWIQFSQALWLSGYSDRLEIYFLREQEFESLRRRDLFALCQPAS
jgi:hypothetical protein